VSLLNKNRMECRELQMQLEDVGGAAPGAKELPELLAALSTAQKEHVLACVNCRATAENFLASRALLAELSPSAELGGPWFATRVMAAIAARKTELSRVADTWTFLPKLAARLTWASAIALLLASTWLYQKPVSTPAKPVVTDITGEPFADSAAPANDDEVLVTLAERTRNER
jgi:hypothetical protein